VHSYGATNDDLYPEKPFISRYGVDVKKLKVLGDKLFCAQSSALCMSTEYSGVFEHQVVRNYFVLKYSIHDPSQVIRTMCLIWYALLSV